MFIRFLNIWRKIQLNSGLKKKFFFTLFIFLIFRLFSHIPAPMIDLDKLKQFFANNTALSLFNVLSGGTLSRFSIMAVGINPYISASIIIQLLTMVYPSLKELQKDGESGRAKINQYIREHPEWKEHYLDLNYICTSLCELDDLFPPNGLWVEYYGINSLESLIIINNKKKIKSNII